MKISKFVFSFICAIILMIMPISAAQSTAYTYTISVDGNWIRTQDAYIPSKIYLRDCGLSDPKDIFLKDNKIYVADTGNKRVLIYERDTEEFDELKYEEFSAPCGIFVCDDGTFYIADSSAEAVFVFNSDKSFKLKIGRPESELFGSESVYQPKNVVVSSQNNIFVVGYGAYEGIMQFDEKGEFQGYFAANKKSLTAFEMVQQLILNEEQLNSLDEKIPNAIYNIDITDRDLLYSVTQTAEGGNMDSAEKQAKTENCLKLHNMAGANILSVSKFMDDEWNFVDVASDKYGNSVAVTQTGLIYEYDSDGNLIFSFGGRSVDSDSYGLISVASAVDIDDNGVLFILDSERDVIQTFAPTDFATITHKAVYQMNNGDYENAEQSWQEILKLNGMSKIAHVGYGRTLMRQQRYSEALEHFKLANDRDDYSECFWELRDRWLTSHMAWFIVLICVIILAVFFKGKFIRKKPKNKSAFLMTNNTSGFGRLLADIKFSFSMLAHPIDGYYYLKKKTFGTVYSSSVLFLLMFVCFLADNFGMAFIFNGNPVSSSVTLLTIIFFACVLLWVVGNYMVSTINDGEGSLGNIFTMTAYSVIPYIVITPIKVLLTYVFTQNESFFITLLSVIAIGWSVVLVFIGLMNTQNYNFGETVKNVILTVFIMILAIVAVAIVYLIWTQLVSFITEVVQEVIYYE